MVKKTLQAFGLAFQNIRSHFFHTLLSILGIVIGVASLVAILSLIDGMEEFAQDQITKTTSLKSIVVNSDPYTRINDVRVRRDSFHIISYNDFRDLKLTRSATINYYSSKSSEVRLDTQRIGATVYYAGSADHPSLKIGSGRLPGKDEIESGARLAVVNKNFAKTLDIDTTTIVGKQVAVGDLSLTICGVLQSDADKDQSPRLYAPITLLTREQLKSSPPSLVVEAGMVEDVPALKKEIEKYLAGKFKNAESEFSIVTNEWRVKQAAQGFLLFRVVMGLIVGISVIVGGIGVMNVLLISVTERTAEIGIRKAVGANKQDIALQFLSESITVSALGSFAGLILGIVGTLIFIPIIKAITKVPFQAAFTWTTLVIISIIAVVVGIAFGTYPAMRASRLDPVDAIRHE